MPTGPATQLRSLQPGRLQTKKPCEPWFQFATLWMSEAFWDKASSWPTINAKVSAMKDLRWTQGQLPACIVRNRLIASSRIGRSTELASMHSTRYLPTPPWLEHVSMCHGRTTASECQQLSLEHGELASFFKLAMMKQGFHAQTWSKVQIWTPEKSFVRISESMSF